MIREITRPSTARYTLPMYIGLPKQGSCCRLGDVMNISATRFLQRKHYDSKDLYDEAAPLLNLKGGTLSVDDSVLDKPYSHYLAFVGYFWSGKHHRTVKGINLITVMGFLKLEIINKRLSRGVAWRNQICIIRYST